MTSPLPPFDSVPMCAACGLARHIGGTCGVPPSPPFPADFASTRYRKDHEERLRHHNPHLEITCPRCGYRWNEATVTNLETP